MVQRNKAMGKVKIQRTIVWNESSSASTISIEDYFDLMKKYGQEKAKSVRSARKYLRSLGLVLNRDGEIVRKE